MNDYESQEKNERIFVPTSEIIAELNVRIAESQKFRKEHQAFLQRIQSKRKEAMTEKIYRFFSSPWFEGFLAGLLIGGIVFFLFMN